ncbi:MAG TPA: hypothetical protein VJ938_05695 [Acidimicrobiia bacterium]|nr:hypothetical protein [Acidimicrobiia bacterium]
MDQEPGVHFLGEAEMTTAAHQLFDADIEEQGYVMNLTTLWAHGPGLKTSLFDVIGMANAAAGLTQRQRGVLISALASTMGDSYCSLAWGTRLANAADPDTAAHVLRAEDALLAPEDRILADWARRVTDDPGSTSEADVEALRQAGFDDQQIFAMTVYVALRIAFSTVNDALGAQPDGAYRSKAPEPVLAAVAYGRPIAP